MCSIENPLLLLNRAEIPLCFRDLDVEGDEESHIDTVERRVTGLNAMGRT
jgi:hypothetical protein